MYWLNLKPACIFHYTIRSCQYFQKEDLPLVITFVDVAKNNCEGFVGNHLCEEGTTGEAINQTIINALSELGLSMC